MNDFVKIFLVLCACVGAFMYGRNYGETTFKDSAEYKEMMQAQEEAKFAKSELENIKAKFQNVADQAETRKQEELLGQILQIFLADLGLKVSNPQTFVKGPATTTTTGSLPPKVEIAKPVVEKPVAEVHKPEKVYDYRRLKSYEWILQNSRNSQELKKNLKNVEIKNLNLFLNNATSATRPVIENIFGEYRGRIMDISGSEYGSLALTMAANDTATKQGLKGNVKIFKNGKQETSQTFRGDGFGYVGPGTIGYILEQDNRFFQLYKINETQQIAGFYYERLMNGTTKTIGTFVLNRTDQF